MSSNARRHFILFSVIGYAVSALAWIFLSDKLLPFGSSDDAVVLISTIKGVAFVVVTTLLLFFALKSVPPEKADSKQKGAPTTQETPRRALYIFAIVVVIALVVALVTASIKQSEKFDRDNSILLAKNVAQLLEREIIGRFEKVDVALHSIAYVHQLGSGKSASAIDLSEYIRDQKRFLPNVTAIAITDSDGVIRHSSESLVGKPINVADRKYFTQARDDRNPTLIVTGPVQERINGIWSIVLARRFTTSDGQFGGVIFATLATAHFNDPLSSVELGAKGAATIRALDLALVHRFPDTKGGVGSKSVSQELKEHLIASPNEGAYIAKTQLDDIERINVYRRLGAYPFYILVGLATDDLREASRTEVLFLLGLGSLAIVAAMFATLLAYRTYRQQADDLDKWQRIDEELNLLLAERTKLNDELVMRANDAESANRAKSEFVANMSHEIRTPMNAILGLTYMLEKIALPGDAAEMVRRVRQAGKILLSIINDILDFSKIESGRLEIERTPFRLGDVLDNLSTIMSANAQEKEIELIIAMPPGRTRTLKGDALRLGQILVNLTGNAIKFTERGHVAVSISVISESDNEITLRFSVSDTGIGIPAEKQEEIFAPFLQADNSTSRRYGGSGLGLTISKRLVEAMGGELHLTSVPGSGSEFWFVLTFDRTQDEWLASPALANLPVLIAEHNPITREALRGIVDGLGWHPTTVGSGQEAIAYIESKKSNTNVGMEVLLIDFKIRDTNGLATAKAIRTELKDASDPIVIMVTAFSNNQFLDHPDSHFADAILTKPVTPSTLFNAVARAIRVRQGGEEQAPARTMQRLINLRILVVDDSEINRDVAQRIFSLEGATVTLASDGQQAVNWLLTHSDQIDIVLMDIQMPVMNGYDATRRIRREPALANLPIIALTAGAFIEQQELANEAGMNGFIAKPFDVDAAIALIIKLSGRVAAMTKAQQVPIDECGRQTTDKYPGLDIGEGLARIRSRATYQKLLSRFMTDNADFFSRILVCNRSEGSMLAHRIKGAAGNLAITEVALLAGRLEQEMDKGTDSTNTLNELQEAWNIARTSIESYIASPLTAKDTEGEHN